MLLKKIKVGLRYETNVGTGECLSAGGTHPVTVQMRIDHPFPRGVVNLYPRDVLREAEPVPPKVQVQAKSFQRAFARLAKRRAQLAMWTRDLNEQVKEASAGRAHHSACALGGLFTGLPADSSGAPCWCGHDGWSKEGDSR